MRGKTTGYPRTVTVSCHRCGKKALKREYKPAAQPAPYFFCPACTTINQKERDAYVANLKAEVERMKREQEVPDNYEEC